MSLIPCPWLAAAASVMFLLAGCGQPHRLEDATFMPAAGLELTTVPYFQESEGVCGPSALATLLVDADAVTMPEFLGPDLAPYLDTDTLPQALAELVARHERVPYLLRPDIASLAGELQAGRAVLVQYSLGGRLGNSCDLGVVVGMLGDGQVVMRSADRERLILDQHTFIHAWHKRDNWAMVALRTDELPADHNLHRYLATVSQLEMAGYVQLAEQCYTTILYQHPHNDPAVFGLANTMFIQHHYRTAATFYSYLLKRDPSFTAAANNLAESLAALGCYSEAIELLDRFL